MSIVDFTVWTETDIFSCITVSSTSIVLDDANRVYDSTWVYKDFTSGYWNGDFEFRFEFTTPESAESESGAWLYPLSLTNQLNEPEDIELASDDAQGVYFTNSSGTPVLRIYTVENGSRSQTDAINIAWETKYYITLIRDDDGGVNNTGRLTIYICTGDYYGEEGASLISSDTLDCGSGEQNDFRYIMLGSPRGGGTSVTTDATIENLDLFPDSKLVEGYTSNMDSQTQIYNSTSWAAQTFTPHEDCTLKTAVLKLYRSGSPGTVSIGIRNTSGGQPTGADLISGVYDGDTLGTNNTGTDVEFNFNENLELTAGTQYAIVLHADSGDGSNWVGWKSDGGSSIYSVGTRLTSNDGGSSWTDYSSSDHYFKIYAESADLEDYYNIEYDNAGSIGDVYWKGQQFTATSTYYIDFIYLLLYRVGSPGTLNVGIYEVDGSGFPTGSPIAAGSLNSNSLPTSLATSEWTKIDLSSYQLSSGTQYAIVVSAPSSGSSRVWWVHDVSSPTYTGGNAISSSDSGASWGDDATTDKSFEVYSSDLAAPTITDQSTDTTVDEGDSVNLYITATGIPTPTYQWYKDDVAMSGEVSDTLSFTADRLDAGTYKCVATNSEGSDTSDDIILTVRYAPEISSQSNDTYANAAVYTTISVTADGLPSPTYQWYKDEIIIVGATNSSYSFYMSATYEGTYKCTLTNVVGSVDSDDIEVVLTTNPRTFNPFNLNTDLDV